MLAHASIIVRGDVSLDGLFKLCIVCAINLCLLLSLVEHKEAGLAGEGSAGKTSEDLFWDKRGFCTEKLHFDEVLIESHVQRPVVLLHRVAPTEKGQM